jgi:hypothetical protein
MTKAKDYFKSALVDTENLMWFHSEFGGDEPGRRAKYFQSLSKSAVILLCSAWEAYVESVILEVIEAQIASANEARNLPATLQTLITVHMKRRKEDASWLEVAGEGWRKVARQCCIAELDNLHAPHTKAVSAKFRTIIGIAEISDSWRWKAARNIDTRIDKLVELRGDLAHATSSDMSVAKTKVTSNINLVERVVECTDSFLISQGLFKRPRRAFRRIRAAGP